MCLLIQIQQRLHHWSFLSQRTVNPRDPHSTQTQTQTHPFFWSGHTVVGSVSCEIIAPFQRGAPRIPICTCACERVLVFWSVCCVCFCLCMWTCRKKSRREANPLRGWDARGWGVGGDAVWIVSFTQINTAFVVFPGMCHVACWRQRPFGAIGVGAKCVSGLR